MTISTNLITQLKLHARIDHDDEDAALVLMLEAACGDVLAAAGWDPVASLPDDLAYAVIDQAAMFYDARGNSTDRPVGLSMAASRIVARYRGVSAGNEVQP